MLLLGGAAQQLLLRLWVSAPVCSQHRSGQRGGAEWVEFTTAVAVRFGGWRRTAVDRAPAHLPALQAMKVLVWLNVEWGCSLDGEGFVVSQVEERTAAAHKQINSLCCLLRVL